MTTSLSKQNRNSVKNWHPGAVLLVFVLLLFASSTVSDATEDAINQHRQVQTEAMPQQVHDDQLRETMLQLNALVSYSEQPAIPLDDDSKEFLQALLDTVKVVAVSAQNLKQEKQIDHLGAQEQARFLALAEQLYGEAVSIDLNARNMNVDEMNRAFLNLNQTCISCHKVYRSL